MKIVVIGGTGRIGSKVVAALEAKGHHAVAAAPSTGIDAVKNIGLEAALAGANVVVDVANVAPPFDDQKVREFFTTSTTNLLAAEARTGVRHHVALSIVGTDRLPGCGYFEAKLAQEKLIEAGPIPFTIVHATQFFDFMQVVAGGSVIDGAIRVSSALVQPIAPDDVAEAMTDAALAPPAGHFDIAGPETFPLDELVRRSQAAWKDTREVITDRTAPYFGGVPAERSLVPLGAARLGKMRYSAWLG